MDKQWFALRTKSNREWITASSLGGQGYETFLPLYGRPVSRKSDKPTPQPLFPGYVFCRFDVKQRLPIVQNSGVVHIVSAGRIPVPLLDDEIDSLKIVTQRPTDVDRYPSFVVGQMVKVTEGPLRGAMGTIIQDGTDLLVVSITLLQRSVSIAVAKEWVQSAVPVGFTPERTRAAGAVYS